MLKKTTSKFQNNYERNKIHRWPKEKIEKVKNV